MRSGAPSRPILGIIFDGDDTLWNTERLYDAARAKARRVVEEAGLDGSRWEELERRIDVENVADLGFTTERFPTSCVQAHEQLSHEGGILLDSRVAARVRKAARTVFDHNPRVVYQARKTLEHLRARGQKLALLTKGDSAVQRKRIETSGLGDLFDVIEIVPVKSPEVIRDVAARLGVDAASACMVGNSVRSDILPAVEAGLQAVWINAHVWEYERAWDHLAHGDFTTLPRLADIRSLLSRGTSA
jgi:putative hydrolase of the HAD superfamily